MQNPAGIGTGLVSEETRDREFVLRDPHVTLPRALGTLFVAVLVSVPYALSRFWFNQGAEFASVRSGFRAIHPWLFFGLMLVAVTASLFSAPRWVVASADGLSFRSWWRAGFFPWTAVDSFEVRDSGEPGVAYVRVRIVGELTEAVRLPLFQTITATELVADLREMQHVFCASS